MKVSNNYIAVEKFTEPTKEGFTEVEVQDNFIYKGVVTHLPECPVYVGNEPIIVGSVVLFAKYSPDTHDIKDGGKEMKFVSTKDILAVL